MSNAKFFKAIASGAPLLIISGLLYAGFFIKPEPRQQEIKESVFERGDRYYSVSTKDGVGVWLVGSDGKILKSNNSGADWKKLNSGTHANLQDIAVWNEKQAVVVGNGPKILKTDDGGQSWISVELPKLEMATKLLRVRQSGNGEAWAVGEGSMILHTQDYGATWSLAGKQEDVAWNDIFFQGKDGWLVGEFGRIKLTNNNGKTWSEIQSPVKSSLMSVLFKNMNEGVAVGLNGVILNTNDGGAHWNVVDSPSDEHLFGLTWDGHQWIAVGDKGVVLVSNEASSGWQAKRTDQNDRAWYVSLAEGGEKYFLAGAKFTSVAKAEWQLTEKK